MSTTTTRTDDLAAAAEACRDLAGEIIGRAHGDAQIREEERLHALARRLDALAGALPDMISRESIVEALRDAHENDSAADAVEYVSDLVGWCAEDDDED